MTHVESTELDPLMQGDAAGTDPSPSPQARVDASRVALQQWITRTYHPERLVPFADGPHHRGRANEADPLWLRALVESLSDVPIGRVAARYLRRWWRRHPLRATAELGDQLGRELLTPTAEKHPWLLLGGAVVAGALLSRLRPWRWVSRSAVLGHLVPPLSLASILASLTSLFRTQPPEDAPPAPDQDGDAQGGPAEAAQADEAAMASQAQLSEVG